ncbi:hypothetical protein T09_11768, partial [Trichinella sp. T9]
LNLYLQKLTIFPSKVLSPFVSGMFFVVFNSLESTNVVQWLTSLLPPL